MLWKGYIAHRDGPLHCLSGGVHPAERGATITHDEGCLVGSDSPAI